MQQIHSLYDFFALSGADVRLYHMGRRISPCTLDTLSDFEKGEIAWPVPWQGQARLAMLFRLGDMEDPLIWFLAFPLDEQGHLEPALRDAFLERLLDILGRNAEAVAAGNASDVDNLMKDNPLAFPPSLTFQAMLHAHASHDLGLPASEHLEPVEAFFTGQGSQDWRALGLQGLADYVARLEAETRDALIARLPKLHNNALVSLCYCLEHAHIDNELAEAIRQRGEQQARQGDIEGFCACIRAIGNAGAAACNWFDALLGDSNACGPDALVAMAARGWEHLEDGKRLPLYLERVAQCEQADFLAVARDLAMIPRLRLPVLMTLRQADQDSIIGQRLRQVRNQQ
uniref:DUF3549 family protein n=1 Tax=Halomonas sp. TaxID=1486246 RepID=UPI002634BF58|nr:DUF3549 family protein [Halomonas sp.]